MSQAMVAHLQWQSPQRRNRYNIYVPHLKKDTGWTEVRDINREVGDIKGLMSFTWHSKHASTEEDPHPDGWGARIGSDTVS